MTAGNVAACWTVGGHRPPLQYPSAYLPLRTGPNAGGEMRRLEVASYADATRRIRSSAPGSARNTKENGKPGAGSIVGVLLLVGTYRFRSGLSVKVAS